MATVTIQPDATAGKDAYVNSGAPDANYGTNSDLYASALYYSYLQFDLTSIASTNYVFETILGLYAEYGATQTNSLYDVTEPWSESTITWNTKPSDSGVLVDTVTNPTPDAFAEWDVSNIAKLWHEQPATNFGVVIKGTSSASAELFYSSYYISFTSRRPKLTVTYYARPTVTITALNGTSGSPTTVSNQVSGMTISGVYTSDDSKNMAYKRHQIYDSANNLIWDSGNVSESKTTGQTVSATVPDIPLIYGTKYYWRWMATDVNGGKSDWSSVGYFISTLSAPNGLTTSADTASCEIDLAWTAHTGENLAGYRIYRKKSTESTYAVLVNLWTTNTYSDKIAASGVTYDYKVSAVADDGYESALSSSSQRSVTFTKWMINDLEVKLSSPVVISLPRRASSRIRTDGTYEVQDLGLLPRRAQFTLRYESYSALETLLATFTAGLIISYRDPQGRTFRGKIISDITDNQWDKLPLSRFYGDISFEAVEVTA